MFNNDLMNNFNGWIGILFGMKYHVMALVLMRHDMIYCKGSNYSL